MKGKKGDYNLLIMLITGIIIIVAPLIYLFRHSINGISIIMLTLIGIMVAVFGGWVVLDFLS